MCRALKEVVAALNGPPALAFDFGLGSRQRRLGYAGVLQSRRSSPFSKEVEALDGVVIQQKQRLTSDVQCVADCYCRKRSYSLNTQAICDADYQLRWMSYVSPGMVLEDRHCIVADEA